MDCGDRRSRPACSLRVQLQLCDCASVAPRRGLLLELPPNLSKMTITHEFPALLIPKAEGERFETAEQSDRLHALKERIGLVTSLQIVVRNTRAQMVNVVEADVA